MSMINQRRAMLCLLWVFSIGLVLALPSVGHAEAGFQSFSVTTSTSQAGAHPDLMVDVRLNRHSNPPFADFPDADIRSLGVDLPAGLMGDVTAAPTCSDAARAASMCSPASQVGYVDLESQLPPLRLPIFNLERRNDSETARLAFTIPLFDQVVLMSVTTRDDGDYGLHTMSQYINTDAHILGLRVVLWGVPADPTNDPNRIQAGSACIPPNSGLPSGCALMPNPGSERRAYLSNPTSCTGPMTAVASGTFYGSAETVRRAESMMPETEGCQRVPFKPTVEVTPGSREAGAPSGYQVALDVPQPTNPDGLTSAHVRKAVVTLPEGVTLNPSSADGLKSCGSAALQLGVHQAATCPDASKLGTVAIDVPILGATLTGGIYLRDPMKGNLFRLVILASGFGVNVKIPGEARADPVTGRLVTTFDNTPQTPFSSLRVNFMTGPRAPMTNPAACGTYTATAELTAWSEVMVTTSDNFAVDSSCTGPRGFSPAMTAGMSTSSAGSFGTFHLRITRDDHQQELSRIDAHLPAGVIGLLSTVTPCREVQAATASCGAESQVGTVTVGAGAGSSPLYLPGRVYLTEGYRGAPFGLSFVVPAVAGPFDLGLVNVRAAVNVDPITAEVSVDSDPLPRILEGIPLRIRDVRVAIDRPRFMKNATNCDPLTIDGTVGSNDGAMARLSVPFQVQGCSSLRLAPKLQMSFTGAGQTTDGRHPGLQAVLAQAPGQANLKKVRVRLPLSIALDPDNANGLCGFVDGSKPLPTCPSSSIVGTASVVTPVLKDPLTGPVYFVKNVRIDPKSRRQIKTLPKLVIPLEGDGVAITLTGTSQVVGERLVTVFDHIPDAPVSRFALTIKGGRHGILVVSDANICGERQIADHQMDGQNHAQADGTTVVTTTNCKLQVVSSGHDSKSLSVKVGGLGEGKVKVSGQGIVTTSRTIRSSAVATLKPEFTKATRTRLAQRRDVKLKLALSFSPKKAGGKTLKIRKTLVVHAAKARSA